MVLMLPLHEIQLELECDLFLTEGVVSALEDCDLIHQELTLALLHRQLALLARCVHGETARWFGSPRTSCGGRRGNRRQERGQDAIPKHQATMLRRAACGCGGRCGRSCRCS